MLSRVISFSLKHRAAVCVAAGVLAAWGVWALIRTPVDAIPDLSDNQVIVFTDWPGRSPQEVEDQITYPLAASFQGLAGVRVVRSQSNFGNSSIYVIFNDNIDAYFARARVLERLTLVGRQLPAGVTPTLGPDATGVGHIFWYTLESDRLSLAELRTLQDWFVRYQLNSVPGVAEVASVGGFVEQFQVDIDPNRLRQYGITLDEVVHVVGDSSVNTGGGVIESAGAWTIVRGIGLVQSTEDLERMVLKASRGTPVLVRDIASVRMGSATRTSALINGDHEAVGGVIVARSGENAREVIAAVKARIDTITPALPAGVHIVPFYDRSILIDRAVDTLRWALIEAMLLVTLAHLVFLRHFRSVLAVTLPLPLAVLTSFLLMYYGGISSNIMSLAGIAIAVGVLVDAGIVVTENAFRTLEQRGGDHIGAEERLQAIADGTRLVGRPVLFSLAIILFAFLPVLTLTGQEGKLFRPLAWTKTFAVFAATALAVTLVPVLCTYLLKGKVHKEEDNVVMRGLRRLYAPALDLALRRPAAVLVPAALLFAGALLLIPRIGTEFMPPLDEGDRLFMPVADASVSLNQNAEIAKRQNTALLKIPEVTSAVAKVARADTSTDPAPLNMTETVVSLKPREQWRAGLTPRALNEEMMRAVQFPGVTNIWTMPIVNRIDMLTTGVRSELGLKIFGRDLAELEALARRLADELRTIPGAASVYPEQVSGAQYLNISIDRDAASRFGITVADVQRVVDTAIGESTAATVTSGRRRVPVRVRYAQQYRDSPAAIGGALVSTPAGPVPLSSLAHIEAASGPAMIPSENGMVVLTVLLNVTGRDIGGFVDEASARIAERVSLPPGYFTQWSGQYESQSHARARLGVVVPLAIVVIVLLLYGTYRSWVEAAHVMLAVPFALTGGIFLLWLSGYHASVAVWVGFIALFGTAVQTGMLMVLYLQEAVAKARARDGGRLTQAALRQAVVDGALLRLRPKVMTSSTVILSLLPIMWTSRVGADVLKPMAVPVLGGMVSSLLHVLVITPVIFFALRRRDTVDAFQRAPRPRRVALVVGIVAIAAVLSAGGWWLWHTRTSHGAVASPASSVRVGAGESAGVRVAILGPKDGVRVGAARLVVEFRDAATDALIDVTGVRVSAAMPMPGMVMTAGLTPTALGPGRFSLSGDFTMAGVWSFTVEWTRGTTPGQTAFDVEVH